MIYTAAHGNAGSLTHWESPRIASSWMLVRFVSIEPWWELLTYTIFFRSFTFFFFLSFCLFVFLGPRNFHTYFFYTLVDMTKVVWFTTRSIFISGIRMPTCKPSTMTGIPGYLGNFLNASGSQLTNSSFLLVLLTVNDLVIYQNLFHTYHASFSIENSNKMYEVWNDRWSRIS